MKKRRVPIAIVMGSQSDWPTLQEASLILKQFNIAHDCLVVSAHRTPGWLYQFALDAKKKGYEIIIAGAGGAAHLPGMIASLTALPVLGVPVESRALKGLDSLLSIAQMPAGVPVASFAIGTSGAKNAGLHAVRVLSLRDAPLSLKLDQFIEKQTSGVLKKKTLEKFRGK